MEKRARFRSGWLPYALVLPQIAVTVVFFFWPAVQALYQSVLLQDPFGGQVEFVGAENFIHLYHDPFYRESFRTTAIFSALVAALGLTISLVLAVFADRVSDDVWHAIYEKARRVATQWTPRPLAAAWRHLGAVA